MTIVSTVVSLTCLTYRELTSAQEQLVQQEAGRVKMCVSSLSVFTLKYLLYEAKEMKLPVLSPGTTHPTML